MKKRCQYYILLCVILPISFILALLGSIFVSNVFFHFPVPILFIIGVLLNSIKCPRCGYPINKRKNAIFLNRKIIIDDECENCGYSLYNEKKQ